MFLLNILTDLSIFVTANNKKEKKIHLQFILVSFCQLIWTDFKQKFERNTCHSKCQMEKSDSEKNTFEFSIQTHTYNEYV